MTITALSYHLTSTLYIWQPNIYSVIFIYRVIFEITDHSLTNQVWKSGNLHIYLRRPQLFLTIQRKRFTVSVIYRIFSVYIIWLITLVNPLNPRKESFCISEEWLNFIQPRGFRSEKFMKLFNNNNKNHLTPSLKFSSSTTSRESRQQCEDFSGWRWQ